MCLFIPNIFHHNNIAVTKGDDLRPFRPVVPVPTRGRLIVVASSIVHHNNIRIPSHNTTKCSEGDDLGNCFPWQTTKDGGFVDEAEDPVTEEDDPLLGFKNTLASMRSNQKNIMDIDEMREELGEKQQMKLLEEKNERVEKMKVKKEELEECKAQLVKRLKDVLTFAKES